MIVRHSSQRVLLTLLLALPITSSDLYLPSLHAIGVFFQTSHFDVQLTLTVYFLTFGFIQLLYGPLSDRFGRKPIILLSLAIYMIATIGCALANSVFMLILFRCIQAFGAGSGMLIFAIVRDLQTNKEAAGRQIATMSAVVAISPIIGPILGGIIQTKLTWQWNFYFLSIIGVVLLLWACYALPETNTHQRESFRTFANSYQQLLTHKVYLSYTLSASFAFGALFAYISAAPFIFLTTLNYSPKDFGAIFALAAIGYVFGAWVNGKLINYFDLKTIHHFGLVSLTFGAVVMFALCELFNSSGLSIVIPQIICELGISIVVATSITLALQPIPDIAGAGSAFIGFLRFMSASLASICVTLFYNNNISYLAVIIFIFAILSTLSVMMKKEGVIEISNQ